MTVGISDSESKHTGVILPAHYGHRHYRHVVSANKLKLCDELAAELSHLHRIWNYLSFASQGPIARFLTTASAFLHGDMTALEKIDTRGITTAAEAKKVCFEVAQKYNDTCLKNPTKVVPTSVVPKRSEADHMRTMTFLDLAWDSAVNTAVEGMRYASAHPWQVAGVACLGVALVLAPEFFPALLAL